MATGTYSPDPFQQYCDNDGNPLSGGLLYTYAAGTTTPLATYSNVSLTTANANPVVLDSAGRCTLFLAATSYKYVLKTSAGVTIATRDNVGAVPTGNVDNDVTGTAGEALTATQCAYLGAGSWSKADADAASTSTLPEIAFVVTDVLSGADSTFRKSGRMTGFSGLTPGTAYYVSATAGEITATAPTNARYVGTADSISSLIISPNPPPATTITVLEPRIKSIADLRLSLTTALPVTVADVTAATTLYAVPYNGNVIGLYTGTLWTAYTFPQLSIAVPAVANQVYDVFLDYNDGTPALALVAWTNDTTRATALTTQDGIPVKTGDTQQRHIGTVRTVTASQLNDSYALRHVWNRYNQVLRPMRVLEATNSWTYTTLTWRQANASTANQLDFVNGEAENGIEASVIAHWANTDISVQAGVGIGLDSTSAPATGSVYANVGASAAGHMMNSAASFRTIPAVGRHTLAWLEISAATGTTTWYGDNGGTVVQSGIFGMWRA